MLLGIYQNNAALLPVIQKYGCLFLCYAQVSDMMFEGDDGIERLNSLWKKAVEKCYIVREVGETSDTEPTLIKEHNCIARNIFGLDVTYDGNHRPAGAEIPADVRIIFGEYRYTCSHFVVLNRNKEIVFDPIGKSNTVAKGYLKSMRWYYAD